MWNLSWLNQFFFYLGQTPRIDVATEFRFRSCMLWKWSLVRDTSILNAFRLFALWCVFGCHKYGTVSSRNSWRSSESGRGKLQQRAVHTSHPQLPQTLTNPSRRKLTELFWLSSPRSNRSPIETLDLMSVSSPCWSPDHSPSVHRFRIPNNTKSDLAVGLKASKQKKQWSSHVPSAEELASFRIVLFGARLSCRLCYFGSCLWHNLPSKR